MTPAPSEFYDLRVVTPSTTLRMAATDADFDAVSRGVSKQVHDPDAPAPFANDWTSRPPEERAEKTIALLREHQGSLSPNDWNIELSAFDGDSVVGGVSLRSEDFATLRMSEIGLWVSFDQQGRGVGRQIVVGALMLAFDHWEALDVVYTALEHNTRSLGLAERLGFEPNGFTYLNQHGERKRLEQRIMTRSRWLEVVSDENSRARQHHDEIQITGAAECLPHLVTTISHD